MEAAARRLQELVEEFEKLPGIGRRTAERLAYHVLRSPRDEALALAGAIRRVKEELRNCKRCANISDGDLCAICSDDTRDATLLCVVEQPKDLLAIEESGSYRGLYHVLQGAFAPIDGIEPEDLTIKHLVDRVGAEGIAEVILATNPDFDGEGTALYLHERLRAVSSSIRVTRIARGMPSGSHLEHVSKNIVSDAVEGRREMR
jgi:recombination protein RecR